jgi:acetylglutamate kinase
VGLGGEDGGLFEVSPSPDSDKVGLVGRIDRVNVDVIEHIAEDYVPVISSVGTDAEGRSYNINADEAAAQVAAAMRAHKAIFMTDVDGWLRDPADPSSRISQASVVEVEEALPGVGGGMRPKLAACAEAVSRGVGAAHIIDGRRPHSLLLELFTDAGIGTKIWAR